MFNISKSLIHKDSKITFFSFLLDGSSITSRDSHHSEAFGLTKSTNGNEIYFNEEHLLKENTSITLTEERFDILINEEHL